MITKLLEDIFNHLLQTDPVAKQKLSGLAGKSVGFAFKNFPFELLATINREGLEFSIGSLRTADCVLHGTPIALASYLNTKNVNPSTSANLDVQIEGDLEFARKISNIFRDLDIDWEEVFAQFMGDLPANQLASAFLTFRSSFERSKDSAQQHLQYLITEKLDQVVTQPEAETFYQAVDKLAADAGKLEQKMNKLTESSERG